MDKILVPTKTIYQWANKKERAKRYMNHEFDKILYNQEIAFITAKIFCKETNIFVFSFAAAQYTLDANSIKDDNGNPVPYDGKEPSVYYGINFILNEKGKYKEFKVVLVSESEDFIVLNENDFKDKALMNSWVQYLVYAYLDIQFLALRKKEKIQKVRTLLSGKSNKQINDKGTYIVNLNNHVIYEYEPSNIHREFIRHCEAWSVRGHYRNYKSGKTIFIKPYIKGKGKLNNKVYKQGE